jgi:energy-coupling factor transporter ATP-binding protein EcfA2
LYVREYLAFNADVYKVLNSRIEEVIQLTGLAPESHKKIGQLSKGYRQRVGLATALLHNPDVLILDEPTTGLDPNQLVEIRNVIKNVGKDKTVFLSTHIMQEVEAICDRVIIIDQGKIVTDKKLDKLVSEEKEQIIEVEFDKTFEEDAQVEHRLLSSVKTLTVSETSSIATNKSIYERLPFPKRSGGLELKFMEWCNKDSSVQAFCKLHEYKHDFLWLRYVKEDGMLGRYSPDFIVRCGTNVYLVETKAQSDVTKSNVQRKLKAATLYCERINKLLPEQRNSETWHYALVGEGIVEQYLKGNGLVSELLNYARVRQTTTADQKKLI